MIRTYNRFTRHDHLDSAPHLLSSNESKQLLFPLTLPPSILSPSFPHPHSFTELKLLCRIAERVFSRSDISINSVSICNLATLLLGMLRTYTTSRKIRVEEEWVLDILRIYGSLLWRMEDVTPHIAFIGRLFGPAGT